MTVERITQHDTVTSSLVAGHYCAEEIGAPFKVYLEDGYTIEPRFGEEIVEIEDLPGLLAAVVQSRVLHPRKLSGAELKFIRTSLRMKSTAVAQAIGVTLEHYSRCESGQKTMAEGTEKSYRAVAFLGSILRDQAVQEALIKAKGAPPVSPAKAQKAVAAINEVFMKIKIEPVADAEEELAFWFTRRARNHDEKPRGDDDGGWEKVEPAEAA